MWNGWSENATQQSASGYNVGDPVYTTYKCRKPYDWGGDAATVGGGGWALISTDQVNHPVDTQGIVDRKLARARGAVDFWMYVFYSDIPVDGTTGPHGESLINQVYYAHAASPNKGYVKRAIMVPSDWAATNPSAWGAYIANEILDRDYMRIKGLPVVGLYDPVATNADSTRKSAWLATVAAIGQPVYKIGYGAVSTSAWTALGLNGGTNYDGALASAPAGTGQGTWAAQVTKDQTSAGQTGFDIIETISIHQDNRPRKGEAGCLWSDYPTVPDAITAIQNVMAFSPTVIMLAPETEVSESGGFSTRVQDALESPTGTIVRAGRDYDSLNWARGQARPGSTSYVVDARQLYCVQTGTWTRTNGITGAYDGDIISSSTANDTIALTCNSSVMGSANTATIELMCPVDPTYGTFDTLKNGVSQGTTSQNGVAAQWQSLKSVSVSAGDTVTFKVSSGTCVLDGFRITYAP